MGYAAAPRVAFIVYGIQTFFTAIIIIITIPYWLLPLKVSLQLARFSVSSLFSTDISIMEIYL